MHTFEMLVGPAAASTVTAMAPADSDGDDAVRVEEEPPAGGAGGTVGGTVRSEMVPRTPARAGKSRTAWRAQERAGRLTSG